MNQIIDKLENWMDYLICSPTKVPFEEEETLNAEVPASPPPPGPLKVIVQKIVGRVAFYPTLIYKLLIDKITSRKWYDRIDENVILGALPFRGMVHNLKEKENVTAVISMNESHELWLFSYGQEGWRNHGIQFKQLATIDMFEAPSQSKLNEGVEFIKNLKEQGSVYIHCKAGRSRSATLVACYLMEKNKWSPIEATTYMLKCRPHVRLGTKHYQAIQFYYQTALQSRQ